MAVFLTILKILGIVLLCIIGLILLIVLLVLFAPIRYKLKGAYGEEIGGELKVRWLFASVVASGDKAEDGIHAAAKIKVFGIPIKKIKLMGDETGHGDKKSKKKKKQNKNDSLPETSVTENTGTAAPPGENVQAVTSGEAGENAADPNINEAELSEYEDVFGDGEDKKSKKKKKKDKKKDKKDKKADGEKADGEGTEDSEKKTFSDRIYDLTDKVYDLTDKASDTANKLSVKKNHVLEFLDRPYTKNTIRRGKKVLKRVFKNILPRKGDVRLLLGLKSPDKTGELIGKLCRFYPFYYKWLHLTPDFYEKKIEADVWCKGRIHLGSMAIPAALLYFSKDFKKTMNLAKKI